MRAFMDLNRVPFHKMEDWRKEADMKGLFTSLLLVVPGISGLMVPAAMAHDESSCDPVETAKLLASDGSEGDKFGSFVAISGNTALVGAYSDDDDGTDSGSAYILEQQQDGSWLETAKLLASDGTLYDKFGYSVAISGTNALVGSYGDDDNESASGSAYIFQQQQDGSWLETAKLLASDGASDDLFGRSVAISETTALIGSYGDDDNGTNSGSAYIFEQQVDGTWLETAKLLASDGASDDYFGRAVAISGTTAMIGAYNDDEKGSAYIFQQQQDGSWLETAKLRASDGASSDYFGYSVAISGTTALIGAYRDDDDGTDSGSAYIFEQQQDGSWLETAKLRASDGVSSDFFGLSVAISGNTALIGVYRDNGYRGSAYIFEQEQDGTWLEKTKLTASDGATDDNFGRSVAILGSTALVGASGDDDNGSASGSAYIFEQQDDGSWPETAKLLASDGAVTNQLGWSVAISGTTALIGAPKDDDNGADCGSAYIFETACQCPDTNGDSLVDVTDALIVIDAWGDCVPDADCPADVDGDGLVNVNDILLVISEWGACE